MKKRILAMLLCLVLVMGMIPAAVIAEDVPETPELPEKPHVHENHEGFTPWGDDDSEKGKLPTTTGKYYLTQDVSMSKIAEISSVQEVVLCLNGKTVDCTATKRAYRLSKGADLAICDCTAATDEEGVYTAGSICNATNTMIMIGQETPGAKLTICDGIFEKNDIASTGSTIIAQGGSQVDIFGGVFRNNSAKTNAGCIYGNTTTINVYGGVFEKNTAGSAGGGFYLSNAHVNMYGGIVRENTAPHGGGVFIQSTSDMVLCGVQIMDNIGKTRGAGIDYLGQSLKIGGDTVITGNKIGEQENNLVLVNGRKLQLDETMPLTVGADIGVSVCTWGSDNKANYDLVGTVTFGTNAQQEDAGLYFHSDRTETEHFVQIKNGNLRFALPKKEHPVEGYHSEDIQWTEWTATDTLPATTGYYVLTDDVNVTANNGVAVNTAQQIVLCLNGYTVTGKTRIYRLSKGADVTICDCTAYHSDDGDWITGHLIPGTADGGVATLVADGEDATITKLTIKDVTIDGTGKKATNGGALQLGTTGSQVKLENCEIKNCVSTSKGGAIHAANGSLEMTGVTITGCTSAHGGAIMAQKNAKITMTDCTVTGNTATVRAGGVDLELAADGTGFMKVAGNTVIAGNTNTKAKKDSNVNLLNGTRRLTFGQMGEQARIGVGAEPSDGAKDMGNVTVSTAAPEGVEAYIFSDGGHDVIRDGSTLKVQLRVHNAHEKDECGHETVTWTGTNTLPTTGGHYYLTGNVNISTTTGIAYNTGAEVTICLNGYQINGNGAGRLFRLSNNTRLRICDCTGHGKLTGGNNATGGVAWIGKDASDSAGGSLTIYGGIVTGNTTGDTSALFVIPNGSFHLAGGQITGGNYRAVLLQNGSFTMSGGKIADITYDKGDGAAIRVTGGNFTMTGGEVTGIDCGKSSAPVRIDKGTSILSGGKISGNTATNAGALLINGGDVSLSGVEISGNTTASNGGGVYIMGAPNVTLGAGTVIRDNVSQGAGGGGGVFATGTANVTLSGVQITGNTAAKLGGGMLFKSTGSLTVQDATNITGNKTAVGENNLQLVAAAMTLGEMTQGAKIGITGDLSKMFLENGLVLGTNATQENITAYFVSDQNQFLEQKDGKLWLMPDPDRLHKDHKSDECGHKDVSWTVWADATTLPTEEGHYYLMTNVTLGAVAGVAYNSGKEITICLNGFTISGNNTGRLFRMSNGTKLNICDCTGCGVMTGGNNAKAGIAWIGFDEGDSAGGSLNIYGGTITGNHTDIDGALFYVDGGSLNIAGGTITENESRIIFLNKGDATISGGKITKNTYALRDGMVLRMANGTFTMSGGEISGNDNGTFSGMLRADKGVVNLTGGKITGNKASSGPALVLAGAEATLAGVEITNNRANGSGGAVYIMKGSKLTVKSGTVISGNVAKKWGGAIYASDSELKIEGGSITGNFSEAEGGAIYMSNGTISMSGGYLGYNSTNNNGGAVCVRGDKGVFYLYGGTIEGNKAMNTKSGTGHCGGVLAQGKGSFYMYGGTIRGNESHQMGGGVRVAANSGLGLYGGLITENKSYRGGGVYTDSDCVIEKIVITKNEAKYEGGGFYISGADAVMNSGVISDNLIMDLNNDGAPDGSSGGVCVRAGSTFTMNGGEIRGNLGRHGGGMVVQSSSKLILNDGLFTENRTMIGYGGAVYNSNCTLEILGGRFENNTSFGGGAIYNDGAATIKNALFTGNYVESTTGGIVSGGAVKNAQKRTIAMENCKFEKNTVLGRAGAVDLSYKSVAYINGCEFIDNSASANAGALAVYTVCELYMNDCTFRGNSSMGKGGAFFCEPVSKIEATGCVFENNKATTGGAIHIEKVTQMYLTDCTLSGNTANKGGGTIYAAGGIYLTDTTVTDSKGKACAVTITGEESDGESFLVGINQFKGNVVVEGENGGLEMVNGAFVSIHGDGLSDTAKILVTRPEGGLTKVMVGGYDYVRQGDVYTVTKGELALKLSDPVTPVGNEEEVPVTDPTVPTQPDVTEQEAKNTVLMIFGIVLAAAAVLAVIAVLAVKKMKKRQAA